MDNRYRVRFRLGRPLAHRSRANQRPDRIEVRGSEEAVKALKALIVAVVLWLPGVAFGAIQLTPIVSSGLSSPTFVTHAGDATNRLFITEQRGVVRVLQPGASVSTVFLDISARIASGGERGLLGLAFHPRYASNGRFFTMELAMRQ